MKKLILVLMAPFLMATQCETDEDPVYRTEYAIQNDSNSDLILITEEAGEALIQTHTSQFTAVASNSYSFVLPSENSAFNHINLYKRNNNGNLVLAYEQMPIMDGFWTFNEVSSYVAEYTLVINDDLIE